MDKVPSRWPLVVFEMAMCAVAALLLLDFWFGSLPGPPAQYYVHREMRSLCRALEASLDASPTSSIPQSLQEALTLAEKTWSSVDRFDVTFRRLLPGVDPWGTRYHFRVDAAAKHVTIQSYGPNRRDDGGNEDDVTCSCRWPSGEKPADGD